MTLLLQLLGNEVLVGLLGAVGELQGKEQVVGQLSTTALVLAAGVGSPSLHVAEAEGGQLTAYQIDRLAINLLLQLGAHTEIDHTGLVIGVTGVDTGTTGQGGEGRITSTR